MIYEPDKHVVQESFYEFSLLKSCVLIASFRFQALPHGAIHYNTSVYPKVSGLAAWS
jgi:hypothetical protein